jgi:sulfotransferase
MKTYYFISGLPRSGSTLLSAILRQNPKIYADISSPLQMIVEDSVRIFSECENSIDVNETKRINTVAGLFDGYYTNIDQEIIFDTSRHWTRNTSLLDTVFKGTKIICCVRNISEIINSFEKLWGSNSLYHKQTNDFTYSYNIFERSEELYNRLILPYYISLKEGCSKNPNMIHLVDYESLCKNPEKTISGLYDFLDLPQYRHDFNNLYYENRNFDFRAGIPDLHKVRSAIQYTDCQYCIPEEIKQKYRQMRMEFWKSNI